MQNIAGPTQDAKTSVHAHESVFTINDDVSDDFVAKVQPVDLNTHFQRSVQTHLWKVSKGKYPMLPQ